MTTPRKRKSRISTIDSVNIFNQISGSSVPSRWNPTHSASSPPRRARADIFDIPETPQKRHKLTPPRSEPFPTRQLRSRNTDSSPKVDSPDNELFVPWASSDEETSGNSESRESQYVVDDERGIGLENGWDRELNAKDQIGGSETGEERKSDDDADPSEEEPEQDGPEEDPLPNRVTLWPGEDSEGASEAGSSDDEFADAEDQPISYQQEPRSNSKSDHIEILIDNRSGGGQTGRYASFVDLFGSSPAESEESVKDEDEDEGEGEGEGEGESEGEDEDEGEGEDEYVPEESDGETQRAQQLEVIHSIPADAYQPPYEPPNEPITEPQAEVSDTQGPNDMPENEPPPERRGRRTELQDLSKWLAQEIESSPQGALWETLRELRRHLRNVAVKPMPEFLEGANCEVTEMRQLYYEIVNTSTLTSDTEQELRNLREAVRTEATRIFEYAAEEVPQDTGEGAEMLNQFEAHVVGQIITLATFGLRVHNMLGQPADEQFEGILDLLLWCCTKISNYAQTSYLRGTRARSRSLLLPLKRIIKGLGFADLGASRAPSTVSSRVVSRVSSSQRPQFTTQVGSGSWNPDDSTFTQWTQATDIDIPPSQCPWTMDEEDALRDGVRRFSEYGDPIPLVMSHYGHRLRRRTCRDLRAKLEEIAPWL